ncbi:type VII secretion system-associated protein [Streptantibioticus ferralitis]|uniref:Type VII secretion system-associated protein n=1 Tax=Streptantibioticus ferralitis TaxID=236510 RepID=A0ABT5Z4L3_9ACTN|nr:type VII secretion system-associated protein [Streptantibioticus ferralitis]MDF2258769.1 type VII secretion system-associated protein [Streptantibioticus ferralitis]
MGSTSESAAAVEQDGPVVPQTPVSEDAAADAPRSGGQDEETGSEMPPVPDHVREAARLAPDHWFGMIDPTWSGEGNPPEWAMVGQWRSDLEGEIVEWRDNEDYRPSPRALDWPDPTDPVDAAVQLAATGYGPAEDITRALAEAEVAVFVAQGGALMSAVAPDDETPVVPVFTAPEHLHAAGRLSFVALKVPELLDRLPEGHLIYLNPSGAVSMTVELEVLREAVGAAGDEDGEGGWLGALDDLLPAPAPADPGVAASSEPDGPAAPTVFTATSTVSTVPTTGDLL